MHRAPPETIMKPYVLLLPVAILLGGCPDAKVPKAPPSVPEPKAAAWLPDAIDLSHAAPNRPALQKLAGG